MAWSSTRSKWVSVFLFLMAHSAAVLAEDGLLLNGDFETAPSGGFPSVGSGSDPTATIPSWKSNGTVELVESGQKQGGMILIVPQGAHAVRLGNDAEVSQQVKVEKGTLYSISFSAARTCAQLESLNVSVLPASQTIDLQTLYSVQGWDTYAWAFQAEADDARVVFRNPGWRMTPRAGPLSMTLPSRSSSLLIRPKNIDEHPTLLGHQNFVFRDLALLINSIIICIDNAVLNGDFEEGPWMFRNASLGVLLPTNLDEGTSSLPGWIVESNRAVRYIDSYHFSIPQGKRAIELLSGKEGIISQMVETTPNKPYKLTFALGHAGDSCKQPLAVMAFAGDQAQNIHYIANANATFQTANLNFTAKAEKTRVAFYSVYYNTRSDDMSSLCGPVVDDVRVALSRSYRNRLGLGLMLGLGLFMLVLV
ncbi:hypothetical protein RJ639_025115 [Escallonia herrerae]|uniref:DUF642 domain-containing protein n=1 Tax=Escallonia herrerae TaxID=1293975 RepID=A0AA88S2K4_9ASTE|nr:hypothetical protein RJ639_025115 [Escallonia herrerae]